MAGRTNRRPGKRSAIQYKGGYGAGACGIGEWGSAERFAKKYPPPSNKKAGQHR